MLGELLGCVYVWLSPSSTVGTRSRILRRILCRHLFPSKPHHTPLSTSQLTPPPHPLLLVNERSPPELDLPSRLVLQHTRRSSGLHFVGKEPGLRCDGEDGVGYRWVGGCCQGRCGGVWEGQNRARKLIWGGQLLAVWVIDRGGELDVVYQEFEGDA